MIGGALCVCSSRRGKSCYCIFRQQLRSTYSSSQKCANKFSIFSKYKYKYWQPNHKHAKQTTKSPKMLVCHITWSNLIQISLTLSAPYKIAHPPPHHLDNSDCNGKTVRLSLCGTCLSFWETLASPLIPLLPASSLVVVMVTPKLW